MFNNVHLIFTEADHVINAYRGVRHDMLSTRYVKNYFWPYYSYLIFGLLFIFFFIMCQSPDSNIKLLDTSIKVSERQVKFNVTP